MRPLNTTADPDPVVNPTAPAISIFLIAFLSLTLLWVMAMKENLLYRIQLRRKTTITWWSVFFGVLLAGGVRVPDVDLNGFYYEDGVTQCSQELKRWLPGAIVRDKFVSFSAPYAEVARTYDLVRSTDVDGRSLRELCGHCAMAVHHSPVPVHMNLLFDLPLPPCPTPETRVVFSIIFPESTSVTWRKHFAERMRGVLPPDVFFSAAAQAREDVIETVTSEPHLAYASASAVLLVLATAVCERRNAACDAVLIFACVGGLVLSVMAAHSLSALMRIRDSPFNVMVMPIVIGTGADALMMLLHYRRSGQRKWSMSASPSIVASQLSTAISFCFGMFLPVAHFRSFFITSILAIVISCIMQLTLFPALIVTLKGSAVQKTPKAAMPPHMLKGLLVLLCLAAAGVVPFLRPIRASFSLTSQLSTDSMTYKFLDTSYAQGHIVSPVYAYARGEVNWTRVRSSFDAMGVSMMFDWNDAWTRSELPFREWIQDPFNLMMYGWTLGQHEGSDGHTYHDSVLVGSMPYNLSAGADDDTAVLERLHSEDGRGVCLVNYERLGGYTIHKVFRTIWVLAVLSTLVSTAAGVVLSGWYGALPAGLALLYSFGAIACVLSVGGITVNMMVLVVLLIGPGLIIDYTLHLSYSPATYRAVLFSFLTSVCSALPYLLSSVPGVRDFALVYICFLTAGITTALASTLAKSFQYTTL